MEKFDLMEVFQATLVDGGHTVKPVGRYLVGLKRFGRVVDVKTFTPGIITDYIRDTLPDIENATLGTWKHKGKIYIDTSIAFDNINDALKVARRENQLAIYDIVNNEEIFL